jgi:hypothetical protein
MINSKKSFRSHFRHSRESGNPFNSISSGLLLPAFAGRSFAGVTAFPTFYEIINDLIIN